MHDSTRRQTGQFFDRGVRSRPATPPGRAAAQSGLTIRVSSGTGAGGTRLAAFDAALRTAGVGDFNLVRLSSVIPPQSVVEQVEAQQQLVGGHGDLLYCVYADAYALAPMQHAWAGLAWSRRRDESGSGLFVEHTGATSSAVERNLELSLDELSQGRGGAYVTAGRRLASIEYVDRPVCAVVVASYRRSDWSDCVC